MSEEKEEIKRNQMECFLQKSALRGLSQARNCNGAQYVLPSLSNQVKSKVL